MVKLKLKKKKTCELLPVHWAKKRSAERHHSDDQSKEFVSSLKSYFEVGVNHKKNYSHREADMVAA